MADRQAQDQAAKARIVTHMNNDHHDSIVRYLQHYAKLSSLSAYDGQAADVDLAGLTLSCHGKTYRIPFEPAMSSYREARERVVELDKACRAALGHSDVTVKDYAPPTGLYALEFIVISATFLGYSQRWWFAPGGPVERFLGAAFAGFSWTIQPWLLAGLFIIHGAEMLYFAARKLPKHSINIRSQLWWLWTASSFIEGQFAYMRFDKLVAIQREKQKH
ncbi:related to integral membrane [Lecanosticta acicola]|uniref:Related to integral membrane n=1 Tax=Lecanosticta acicola TaxID=111012 RepID=A0AAI9EFI7_9PEZI|nr:related to integral membrane [Lecanosticta acicola]